MSASFNKNLLNNNIEQSLGLVNERGFPEPLKATCFDCKKEFFINYNPGVGMFSQKNYGLYGTNANGDYKEMRNKPENERGEKICDKSLKKFYLTEKKKFLNLVRDKSKRQTLRGYLYHKII